MFTEFETELVKAQKAGGAAKLPAKLAEIAAEPLSSQTQAQLVAQKREGWRLGVPLASFRINGVSSTKLIDGAEVVLIGCLDGTRTPVVDASGTAIGMAGAMSYRGFFKHIGGRLRFFRIQHAQVATCAA